MKNKKKKMQLKDIAEVTGVSVAAVSYVLNGKGRISQKKQREIRELLRHAGYKPKHFRYPVLYIADYNGIDDTGVIRPYTRRIFGMNSILHEQDISFRTDLIRPAEAAPVELQLQDILNGKPGAVVVDYNLRDYGDMICEFFENANIPVIQIGFLRIAESYDACIVDNFAGGYDAAQYFLKEGHQAIGIIRWNVEDDPASAQKFAGFCCALQEAGRSLPEDDISYCEYHRTTRPIPSRKAIDKLTSLQDPPTAVFVDNSYVSPSLIYPQDEQEGCVPEAIARMDMIHFEAWDLVGLDQILRGKLIFRRKPIKLLRINWEELARMAGARVIARLTEPGTPVGEVMRLAPKLVLDA